MSTVAALQFGGCEDKPAPAPAQAVQTPAAEEMPRIQSSDQIKPGGLPAPASSEVASAAPAPLAAQPPTTPPHPVPSSVSPPPPISAPPAAPTSSPDGKTAIFLGLTAPKPATWIDQPPSNSMRRAEYAVPGLTGDAPSEAARIVVFYFGAGSGGTAEANIERWKGQFKSETDEPIEPQVSRFESDGMQITLAELEGAHMPMGAHDYKPDQLFLSAIVEAPAGMVFIQFVGQTATVEANREAFLAMLRGLRKAEAGK